MLTLNSDPPRGRCSPRRALLDHMESHVLSIRTPLWLAINDHIQLRNFRFLTLERHISIPPLHAASEWSKGFYSNTDRCGQMCAELHDHKPQVMSLPGRGGVQEVKPPKIGHGGKSPGAASNEDQSEKVETGIKAAQLDDSFDFRFAAATLNSVSR
ncbi:hypothetical protein F2P81_021968 [Scophthalmus maximus]|uniref:Uncharacterized protein n=1 Tax=Scophthalmus maximus TaxID=52904 RepID=A0A6A4RXA8_SCOMX|nr:hypothetical protein F2P81_021968 [Scophthalmus maximus]